MIRARKYPWGILEIDNPSHSDFHLLKKTLLETHLVDLKDITHDVRATLSYILRLLGPEVK
jgi:cell division control protein 11